VIHQEVERLTGEDDQVERVHFVDWSTGEFDALLFQPDCVPGSPLPGGLGCEADEDGITIGPDLETSAQ